MAITQVVTDKSIISMKPENFELNSSYLGDLPFFLKNALKNKGKITAEDLIK